MAMNQYKAVTHAIEFRGESNHISTSSHPLKVMVANQSHLFISPDEYLAEEEASPIKHEYFDGDVFAMAGASDAHVTIAGNLFALLRTHVRGGNCRVFMADMKFALIRLTAFSILM